MNTIPPRPPQQTSAIEPFITDREIDEIGFGENWRSPARLRAEGRCSCRMGYDPYCIEHRKVAGKSSAKADRVAGGGEKDAGRSARHEEQSHQYSFSGDKPDVAPGEANGFGRPTKPRRRPSGRRTKGKS